MTKNYLCISIPEELQRFSKVIDSLECSEETENLFCNFGVRPIKDSFGGLIGSAYYSDSGELIKKVLYKGSSVDTIEHYRNEKLFSHEKFDKGKIIRKTLYNIYGKETSVISYKYDRNGQITSIHKTTDKMTFTIEYGYDELMRTNSRVVIFNNKIINKQKYIYDILDRIVEYKDYNQTINVHKVNSKNELVSYTITDIVGNKIVINNKFMCNDYIGTEIDVNAHKTTVKDISYVNNIMLKKPYTSEDDMDYAFSHLEKLLKVNEKDVMKTRREQKFKTDEICNMVINKNVSDGNMQKKAVGDIKLINL